MVRIVGKLSPDKYAAMKWHTQAINITTNYKVNVDFTFPALSAMDVVTWKFHVDDFAKGRYDMILGRCLLIELGLDLKFSENIIEADNGPFNGTATPVVDLGTYIFKDLNTGKLHLNNCLRMITLNKYTSQNMYVLTLTDCV